MMGLLRIPFRRKNKYRRIFTDEGLVTVIAGLRGDIDLLKTRVTVLQALNRVDPIVSISVEKPKAKEPKRRDRTGSGKHFFTSKKAASDLAEWFNRRNNKWLTKKQIQTMSISPLKGIPHASFYRAVRLSGLFEADRTARPHKFRLNNPVTTAASPIPAAPVMYGASLTTISQQLKGTEIPITIHNTKCRWYQAKRGEWLVNTSLPMLFTKINKLFKTYGGGRTSTIKRCRSCSKAGRLPLNI